MDCILTPLAPNNQPSKLFKELVSIVKDRDIAFDIWQRTQSQEFNVWYGEDGQRDENGEPVVVNEVFTNDVGDVLRLGMRLEDIVEIDSDFIRQPPEQEKIEFLQTAFAKAGIIIEVIPTDDIESIGQVEFVSGEKATIKISPSRLQKDTVYHEFAHILIETLGTDNQTVQKAINSLKGSSLYKRVRLLYPELTPKEIGMEALATALGEQAQREYETLLSSTKIKVFINRLLDSLAELFGIGRTEVRQLAKDLVAGNITKFESLSVGSVWQQRTDNLLSQLQVTMVAKELKTVTNEETGESVYVDNEGNQYQRVTNFTQQYYEAFDQSTTSEELKDRYDYQTHVGSVVHKVAELVFKGNSLEETVNFDYDSLWKDARKGARTLWNNDKEFIIREVPKLYPQLVKLNDELMDEGFEIVSELTLAAGNVAGTIDVLAYNKETGKAKILDFKLKEDSKFLKSLFGSNYEKGFNKKLEAPFNNSPASDFNRHKLQLSTYAAILNHYGIEVTDLIIVPVGAKLENKEEPTKAFYTDLNFPNRISLNEKGDNFISTLASILDLPSTVPTEEELEQNEEYYESSDRPNPSALHEIVKLIEDSLTRKEYLYTKQGLILNNKEVFIQLMETLSNEPTYVGLGAYIDFLLGKSPSQREKVKGKPMWSDLGEIERIEAFLSQTPDEFGVITTEGKKELRKPNYLNSKNGDRYEQFQFLHSAYNTFFLYDKLSTLSIAPETLRNLTDDYGNRLISESEVERLINRFEEMKDRITSKMNKLRPRVNQAYQTLTLQEILKYTTDSSLRSLSSPVKMVDGKEVNKTQNELNKDLELLRETIFGGATDVSWWQKNFDPSHSSNDVWVALHVKRYDIELGKARLTAQEDKQELNRLFNQLKASGDNLDWLFEKGEGGKITNRFIQRKDNLDWLTKYFELRKRRNEGFELRGKTEDSTEQLAIYNKYIRPYNDYMWDSVQLNTVAKNLLARSEGKSIAWKDWYGERNENGGYKLNDKFDSPNSEFDRLVPKGSVREQLYNKIEALVSQSLEYYAQRENTNLAFGFIPFVPNESETAKFTEKVKSLYEAAKTQFSKKDQEQLDKAKEDKPEWALVDEMGTAVNLLPFWWAGDNRIEVDYDKVPKSLEDFETILYQFTDLSHTLSTKAKLEPEYLLGLKMRGEAEYVRGRQGNLVVDKITKEPLKIKGSDTNSLEQFGQWLRRNMYSEGNAPNQSEFMTQLSGQLQNAMSNITLSLNIQSAFTDTISGHLARWIDSVGNPYIQKSYIRSGFAVASETLTKGDVRNPSPKAKTKFGGLLKKFPTLEDTLERSPEKGGGIKSQRSHPFDKILRLYRHSYVFENTGEFLTQSSMLYSVLRSKKVKNSKGEEVELYSVYSLNKEGFIEIEEGVTTLEGKSLDDKDNLKEFEASITRLTIALNQRLQGRYREETKSLAESYWYGRLALQFKKYIRPMWVERYGSRGNILKGPDSFYDEFTEDIDKGRYFTFREFILTTLKEMKSRSDKSWQDIFLGKFGENPEMVDYNMRAMAKNYRELAVVLSLAGIALAANSYWDEDKKRKMSRMERFWTNGMLYQIDSITNQMSSFFPIFPDNNGRLSYGYIPTFKRYTTDPYAANAVIEKAFRLANTLIAGVVDPETLTYQGGPYRGQSKLAIQVGQLVPIWNQAVRWQYLSERASYYAKYN